MTNLKPQIVVKHNVGNTISISNIVDTKCSTFLSANATVGTLSLSVDNATPFTASNAVLLLSSIGMSFAEFVTASAHTDTAFTIGATKMPHNRGDVVFEVKYDTIEVYKSSTINGTYSLFSTQKLQVTQPDTVVFDGTGLSTDYYKVRWSNSTSPSTLYSDYSDPVNVLEYPENSVADIAFSVTRAMGVSETDPKITSDFLIGSIDDARKYVKTLLNGTRFAWQQKFEHPIQLLAGTNYVELPADVEFSDTDQSLLAVRFMIGNVLTPYNLRYIDKRAWNQIAFSVMGGNTTTDTSIGATEIQFDSAGDFSPSASGVAYVPTTAYDQTIMQIAYTGVDMVNKKLTGVTGVTRAFPAGTRVWSRPTISQPIYYTVHDGKMFFDRIIPDSMQANNVYIDYYRKLTKINSFYQELFEPYREIYKFYLRYSIKYRKNIALEQDDPDYVKFTDLAKSVLNNVYTGQETQVITS